MFLTLTFDFNGGWTLFHHYISRTFQAGIRGSADRLDSGGWTHLQLSQKYFMLALEAQLTDLLLGAGS